MTKHRPLLDYATVYAKYALTVELAATGDDRRGGYQAYRLGLPYTRCGSCLIIGTPEGVVIVGDWAPALPAVHIRKSIAWFAGDLSPDYLAGKALSKRWVPSLASASLFDLASDMEDHDGVPETVADLRAIAANMPDSEHEFAELLDNVGFDLSEGLPGWGYDPDEVSHLSALQRRFAELYLALRTDA